MTRRKQRPRLSPDLLTKQKRCSRNGLDRQNLANELRRHGGSLNWIPLQGSAEIYLSWELALSLKTQCRVKECTCYKIIFFKKLKLKAHRRVYAPSPLWQRWSEIISGEEPGVRPVRPGPCPPTTLSVAGRGPPCPGGPGLFLLVDDACAHVPRRPGCPVIQVSRAGPLLCCWGQSTLTSSLRDPSLSP